jgi:atypical dual specificity phosphatase
MERWSLLNDAVNEAHATSPACMSTPDLIIPGLFLGDAYHAADGATLRRLGIRWVLNATVNLDNLLENDDDVEYLQLKLRDEVNQSLVEAIPLAIAFIRNALSRDESVLVHCQMGASRSASLVIAYLVECEGFSSMQHVIIVWRNDLRFILTLGFGASSPRCTLTDISI